MQSFDTQHVGKVIDFLRNGRKADDVSLEDVMGLAELMAQSLQSYFKTFDVAIYRELGAMAEEISAMKRELSELQLADMRHQRIPEAGLELDAIVEATEAATNTIMTAAEAIMSAVPADADGYQQTVNDRIVEIFEACSFQDITGQRISKVVRTLGHLESRITTLVERLKIMQITDAPREETPEERRQRELILHGPQLSGEGVTQTDIDAYF
ncbi:protein phosphatase CheZ [Chthonobacter rhizosphaerae]|uniref:protein phosphatase CheZ n=1 Tax=Chthonobacter rhizosphaerae TaxID=2735553 RepID=UPI0015EECB62|nr:protein phosphatase CheZ [Chthonobacter rhizosphaerae]